MSLENFELSYLPGLLLIDQLRLRTSSRLGVKLPDALLLVPCVILTDALGIHSCCVATCNFTLQRTSGMLSLMTSEKLHWQGKTAINMKSVWGVRLVRPPLPCPPPPA